jgi:hypothetical protein
MQIALKGVRLVPAVSILIAVLCAPLAQAGQPTSQASDKPENTVKRLYRDYAWQAIGSAFDHEAIYLVHQGIPELEKYFEPGLARLIRKGDECEKKIQDMCTPDFDYILDSQDPAADDLKISPMGKNNLVRVEFIDPRGDKITYRLDYKMAQTPQGWRIADIFYADASGGGLRDSLLYVFDIVKFNPDTPLAKPDEPPGHFPDTPKGAVQKLYYDYAWQAIGSFDTGVATPIESQSQPELEKYFESGLASSIRADRDCAEKTGKKCALDYSILFNSRKPFAVDLDISQPNRKNQVAVTFKDRDESKKFTLRYDMVRTGQGWRVYDIRYANRKQSLRGHLKP